MTGASPTFSRNDGYSYRTPDTELRSYITTADRYTINPYVIIDAEGGCLYSEALIYYTPECTLAESVVDECAPIASDPNCQIKDEMVDGVSTFRSYASSGLIPLPSSQYVTGVWCMPVEVTKDWWKKERVYACASAQPAFDHTATMERTGIRR